MKKSFFVIAAFAAFVSSALAADSAEKPVVFEKFTVIAIEPPAEAKREKTEIVDNWVRYNVTWRDGAASAYFTTDGVGKLLFWHVVVNDTVAGSFKRLSHQSGRGQQWVSDGNRSESEVSYSIDPEQWAKFFDEKVRLPIEIVPTSPIVALASDTGKAATAYEFVGESYDSNNVRQILVRKVGTQYTRNFPADDFIMLPPKDRPFNLGKLGGKLCPVEQGSVNDKKLQIVAVSVSLSTEPL